MKPLLLIFLMPFLLSACMNQGPVVNNKPKTMEEKIQDYPMIQIGPGGGGNQDKGNIRGNNCQGGTPIPHSDETNKCQVRGN